MSRITVTLGKKTKQAESIVEPLLSSDAALDKSGSTMLSACFVFVLSVTVILLMLLPQPKLKPF